MQTDTSIKIIFSDSGGLNTQIFDENFGSPFSHKSNTFTYDENVKIKLSFIAKIISSYSIYLLLLILWDNLAKE